MGVNQVIYNGEELINLTNDTVSSDVLLEGHTAHSKNGVLVTGNIPNKGYLETSIDPTTVSEYIIPAGYYSGGKIKLIIITHYYYNGVILPKLPSEISEYPYCWIRKNNSTGYYDLVLSTSKIYLHSSTTVRGSGVVGADLWFRIPISTASTASSWGSRQSHSYSGWTIDANRTIFWANSDVMASSTSTSVHFAGSNPIPVT